MHAAALTPQYIPENVIVKTDDEVEVRLDLLTGPRVVEVPEPLASALARAGLSDAFAALAPSRRKEACRQVDEAKGADTRERRIHKILGALA